jgi:peptidoglycan/LPS O-acetylase OafA/YrhL
MSRYARPKEIQALSGIRALPPLILVLYHYCEGHGYRGVAWFDLPVGKGYLWVEFFFALSGFILTHVYGQRTGMFRTATGYWTFLKSRLSRLYPVHVFTLLTMLALMWALNVMAAAYGYVSIYHQPYPPINTGPSFVANLFLVQAWNLFPWLTWNGASWFVSVEFFLCILFPLYLMWSRGNVLQAFALIAVGWIALALLASSTRHGLDLTFHDGVLRGAADFAVGCGLAMLYRQAVAAGALALPGWVYSSVQVLALAFLAWTLYGIGWSHSPKDIWTASALFVLIFTVAFDRGFLACALAVKPMRKLGEWSYAVYMGQIFWLQIIRWFEQRVYPPGETILLGRRFCDLLWWWEPFILIGVCTLWGAILCRWVEMPASRILKRWVA